MYQYTGPRLDLAGKSGTVAHVVGDLAIFQMDIPGGHLTAAVPLNDLTSSPKKQLAAIYDKIEHIREFYDPQGGLDANLVILLRMIDKLGNQL